MMIYHYNYNCLLNVEITLSFIILINNIVVHRSDPRGGLQLNYPESPGKKCGWLPHEFKAEGLVDLKAEVLGYAHSHSALQLMWSCASCCGGAASHAT